MEDRQQERPGRQLCRFPYNRATEDLRPQAIGVTDGPIGSHSQSDDCIRRDQLDGRPKEELAAVREPYRIDRCLHTALLQAQDRVGKERYACSRICR